MGTMRQRRLHLAANGRLVQTTILTEEGKQHGIYAGGLGKHG